MAQPIDHGLGDGGVDDHGHSVSDPDPDHVVLEDRQGEDSVALYGLAHR